MPNAAPYIYRLPPPAILLVVQCFNHTAAPRRHQRLQRLREAFVAPSPWHTERFSSARPYKYGCAAPVYHGEVKRVCHVFSSQGGGIAAEAHLHHANHHPRDLQ
jgi:hypothetical protein